MAPNDVRRASNGGGEMSGKEKIPRRLVITLAILALAGGAIGGFVRSALVATAYAQAPSGTMRTTGIDLVDSAGNRVAYLGTDARHNTSLAFFDARGNKRAELGIGTGDSPRLDINGPDGGSLLSLDLGQRAKPRLMMSDHDFNGRVYLGVVEPNSPSPGWKYDSWVLRFTGDKTRPLAIIGMTTGGVGGLTVFDQSGHSWRTPLK